MFSSFAASEVWLQASETEVGGVELVDSRAEEHSSEEAEAEQGWSDEASEGGSKGRAGATGVVPAEGKDITSRYTRWLRMHGSRVVDTVFLLCGVARARRSASEKTRAYTSRQRDCERTKGRKRLSRPERGG